MILLTGATGYIASHTWLALEAAGFQVAGIDDFSNSSPEVLRRLAALGADVSRFSAGRRSRPRRARPDLRRRQDRRRRPFRGQEGGRRERRRAAPLLRASTSAAWSRWPRRCATTAARPSSSARARPSTASPKACRSARTRRSRRPIRTARPSSSAKASCATSSAPIRPGASPCCATSTRSARTRAERSAKTRAARRTT